MTRKVVLAIGAHPDDIEFYMAGTLLLLKKAGFEAHYLNVASGNCGSVQYNSMTTRSVRLTEARAAAKILGAQFHPTLTNDLEIFYTPELLRSLAATVREVKPGIILTHPPEDYMEDHTNTCRLTVTAAFARGMPNFRSTPFRPVADYETTLYHCMPHSLRDGLRRRVVPGAFVNTTPVQAQKREALAAHKSQQNWLDVSQGMDSYLKAMDEMSLTLGKLSRHFQHAEGWRRHMHLGLSGIDRDPLRDALSRKCLNNPRYARRSR